MLVVTVALTTVRERYFSRVPLLDCCGVLALSMSPFDMRVPGDISS